MNGARVVVSEVNPFRVNMLTGLGIEDTIPDHSAFTRARTYLAGLRR